MLRVVNGMPTGDKNEQGLVTAGDTDRLCHLHVAVCLGERQGNCQDLLTATLAAYAFLPRGFTASPFVTYNLDHCCLGCLTDHYQTESIHVLSQSQLGSLQSSGHDQTHTCCGDSQKDGVTRLAAQRDHSANQRWCL